MFSNNTRHLGADGYQKVISYLCGGVKRASEAPSLMLSCVVLETSREVVLGLGIFICRKQTIKWRGTERLSNRCRITQGHC